MLDLVLNNKKYIILGVGFIATILLISHLLKPASAKLEMEGMDEFIGISNNKLYALTSNKIIYKSINSSKLDVIESDVMSASMSPDTKMLFYSQTKNNTITGTILDISSGEKKQYDNATDIVWVGDSNVLKIQEKDSAKRVTIKLINADDQSKSINITPHDGIASLDDNLVIIAEVGSESDDGTQQAAHIVELYKPDTLTKIKEIDLIGELSALQTPTGQIIFKRDYKWYRLDSEGKPTAINFSGTLNELKTSPNSKIVSIGNKSGKVTIWSFNGDTFINTGTFNTNKEDTKANEAKSIVYDKDSKKIFFMSGYNIYSYNYNGRI